MAPLRPRKKNNLVSAHVKLILQAQKTLLHQRKLPVIQMHPTEKKCYVFTTNGCPSLCSNLLPIVRSNVTSRMETLCNLKAVVWLFCGHILKAAAVSQTESSAHFTSQHQQLSWSCQKKQIPFMITAVYWITFHEHFRLILQVVFLDIANQQTWSLQQVNANGVAPLIHPTKSRLLSIRRRRCRLIFQRRVSCHCLILLSLRWSWVRVLECCRPRRTRSCALCRRSRWRPRPWQQIA